MRLRSCFALRACASALLSCARAFVHMRVIEFGIYYEKSLTLVDIRTLLETHLFEIALDSGMHLHELLRTDATHIFTIYVDIGSLHRLDFHNRQRSLLRLGFKQEIQSGTHNQNYQYDYKPRFLCTGHRSLDLLKAAFAEQPFLKSLCS